MFVIESIDLIQLTQSISLTLSKELVGISINKLSNLLEYLLSQFFA